MSNKDILYLVYDSVSQCIGTIVMSNCRLLLTIPRFMVLTALVKVRIQGVLASWNDLVKS